MILTIVLRILSLAFLLISLIVSYSAYTASIENPPAAAIGTIFMLFVQLPYISICVLILLVLKFFFKKYYKAVREHLITVIVITIIYAIATFLLVN